MSTIELKINKSQHCFRNSSHQTVSNDYTKLKTENAKPFFDGLAARYRSTVELM